MTEKSSESKVKVRPPGDEDWIERHEEDIKRYTTGHLKKHLLEVYEGMRAAGKRNGETHGRE